MPMLHPESVVRESTRILLVLPFSKSSSATFLVKAKAAFNIHEPRLKQATPKS